MATIGLMSNGYRLRGKEEVGLRQIVPRAQLTVEQLGNDQNVGYLQNHINAPKLRNNAYQQFDVHRVLGMKDEETAKNVLRAEPVPDTMGMYPHQGYARGQHAGLAYLSEKPNFGPLMPLASSIFSGSDSQLGQPSGDPPASVPLQL